MLFQIQISTAAIYIIQRRRTRGARAMIALPLFILADLIFVHNQQNWRGFNKFVAPQQMGVSGKTHMEHAVCSKAGMKVRRLLDTLSVLKKSDDELGELG